MKCGEKEWDCVREGKWMNDVVMEIFFREITRQADKIARIPFTLYDKQLQYPLASTKHWIPTDTSKLWILPACYNDHWVLVTIDNKKGMITQYDSLHRNTIAAERMAAYLKNLNDTEYTINL